MVKIKEQINDEIMFRKLISGIVTFATMIFSSFQGNDVSFSNLIVSYKSEKLFMETGLIDAFENDFENIFKSGKEIKIWFDLEVKKSKKQILNTQFYHSVKYDPLTTVFEIYFSETRQSIFLDSYDRVKMHLSKIKYSTRIGDVKKNENINISIMARLQKIRLPQIEKKIDLMMLWHNKKPSKKQIYKIKSYEA